MSVNNREVRVVGTIRAEAPTENAPKSMTVRGLAARYESESQDLGGFTEIIARGAFKSVMENDVRALFNHDANLILGRSTAGTLKLQETEDGLEYEISLPNTQVGRDLYESIQRGDVSQSSFAFSITERDERWAKNGDKMKRTITRFEKLYDISPVTYPAYEDTRVAVRSMPKDIEENKVDENLIDQLMFQLNEVAL